MKVFLTGAAGFIGYHVADRLLAVGAAVAGLDNLSDYYDVGLKRDRLAELHRHHGFQCEIGGIEEPGRVLACLAREKPDVVIHLAAQAGVRYSVTHPEVYVGSNLVGFANVLEACRAHPPRHLLYASSSSVYGANTSLPFRETDATDRPVNFYAATKRANEGMAHSYSHLFGLPATGLRFFTVYGDWGRPDMAFFSFAANILAGKPIGIFSGGRMARDFTYAGDAAEAVARLIDAIPADDGAPHRVVNIASGRKTPLIAFIEALETALGRTAVREFTEAQQGDMVETWADVSRLKSLTGYVPDTSVAGGMARFAAWYREWRR